MRAARLPRWEGERCRLRPWRRSMRSRAPSKRVPEDLDAEGRARAQLVDAATEARAHAHVRQDVVAEDQVRHGEGHRAPVRYEPKDFIFPLEVRAVTFGD